jgi:hypothetical protein
VVDLGQGGPAPRAEAVAHCLKSASKIGSSTSFKEARTTRSAVVAKPGGMGNRQLREPLLESPTLPRRVMDYSRPYDVLSRSRVCEVAKKHHETLCVAPTVRRAASMTPSLTRYGRRSSHHPRVQPRHQRVGRQPTINLQWNHTSGYSFVTILSSVFTPAGGSAHQPDGRPGGRQHLQLSDPGTGCTTPPPRTWWLGVTRRP